MTHLSLVDFHFNPLDLLLISTNDLLKPIC